MKSSTHKMKVVVKVYLNTVYTCIFTKCPLLRHSMIVRFGNQRVSLHAELSCIHPGFDCGVYEEVAPGIFVKT